MTSEQGVIPQGMREHLGLSRTKKSFANGYLKWLHLDWDIGDLFNGI